MLRRAQELKTKPVDDDWRKFEENVKFDGPPFLVPALIDRKCHANTLLDTGCTSYGIISKRFAYRNQLERIKIRPRAMRAYDGPASGLIEEVVKISLDVGGNAQAVAYMYVVPRIDGHDMILGLPWMIQQHVTLVPDHSKIIFDNGIEISSDLQLGRMSDIAKATPISANAFGLWRRMKKKGRAGIHIFAASMSDIDKALRAKAHSDPREKLPRQYHQYLDVFDRKKADTLPPLRGDKIDHKIELIEKDEKGNKVEAPWGPLYNMSTEELLVLRKTLTEYLDKGFIQVSNSPAAAPVLFVKKPGGGLRFCCDYRALNQITKKDRYPLPLIHETLERIGKAQWFTKLDVIAAFHKIRIAEGSEWLTAFRTRFGLFEWLVTPFGLANAPSTFQRYINWTLRDFLDEFASAYLDDVLVFSSGSLKDHRTHVCKVLQRLKDAGLQLDIDKCEFEVQSTKYLGFIVEAGKGVRMDPEKVKAILEWETPRSVKGIRSFLGFANFYRQFIRNFSEIAAPLTNLTKRGTSFQWDEEAEAAFQHLKQLFVSAPILVQFDPDKETVVEADSSGWATGGVLSQVDDSGSLRPCAYFSRKNSPTECNYEIHDKELLAIINCLREWESELSSVRHFTIITDHKNLRYFTQLRRLNERQMRWADTLSRHSYTLQYRPGKLAARPDALSRREQDVPQGPDDERILQRERRLLDPEKLVNAPTAQVATNGADANVHLEHRQELPLEEQWRAAEQLDEGLQELKQAVKDGARRFPRHLGIRVSITECELSEDNRLLFRGRLWVPEFEPLRTRLLQETHDSTITGHPGRDVLYALLSRRFYWPSIASDVRRFAGNCDRCGSSRVWRDRRQGLLKPLPIPERKWREISMDFIQELPMSAGCTNLLVITDRLGKGVILEPCDKIDAPTIARKFIRIFYAYHGIPSAIVSDRGNQFVRDFWSRFCELLKITRRLSTAYHAETDGSTERMNTTLEAYLRVFCTYAQDNWAFLAPMAMLAINNRDSASIGMSPFFLDHGYHVEPLDLPEDLPDHENPRTPAQRAEAIVSKMKSAQDLANATMAAAQQTQERNANKYRDPAPEFRPGDKVWLSLRNIKTGRPSKKLDALNAKYTVLEKIGSHAYRLNTPPGIHNVFHTMLLRPARTDPFPSQRVTDHQPPPQLVGGEEEFSVDYIVDEKVVRRGRGRQHLYLVKWTGYDRPEWTDARNMEDTLALDEWESRKNDARPATSISAISVDSTSSAAGTARRRGVM